MRQMPFLNVRVPAVPSIYSSDQFYGPDRPPVPAATPCQNRLGQRICGGTKLAADSVGRRRCIRCGHDR